MCEKVEEQKFQQEEERCGERGGKRDPNVATAI